MTADFELTGKRALVTGAGRGIGKGIALALAEAGADVGVTALSQAHADRVADEVRQLGRRGFGWAVDGTRVEPMQAMAEHILAELGAAPSSLRLGGFEAASAPLQPPRLSGGRRGGPRLLPARRDRSCPPTTSSSRCHADPAWTRWTGTSARTILRSMTTPAPRCPTCGSLLTRDPHETHSLLAPGERLTPWMIHDLPRIAWIVEYRAGELTDEERQVVRDATDRMLRALESDPV